MERSQHARQIAQRFRALVSDAGDTLADEHYDELALLIEAGIDTAVVEHLERTAEKVERLAAELRMSAEHFS